MIKISLRFKLIFYILLIGCLNCHKDSSKTISHLNLLLPQINNSGLFFKIYAYNGCYRWNISNSNILELKEIKEDNDIEDNCFSSVEVRVKTNHYYDGIIWIVATDRDTKEILKCESRIAPIDKLSISTKMRIFDVGNYEEIELIGFDKEENVFSTLEGLKFSWTLNQNDKFAEIISFKDSLIKTTEMRKQIEYNKSQSDIIVVKGLKTGKVNLKVKLNEQNHKNIESDIYISIIEKFIIIPNIQNEEINLPLCSLINFDLYNIRTENFKNNFNKIVLPNDKFNWKTIENFGIIKNNGYFTALFQEKNEFLIVKDINSPLNNTEKVEIKVNQINNIDLYIKEYKINDLKENEVNFFDKQLDGIYNLSNFENNWNLIIGKKYIIKLFLFDKNNNKLVFPQNFNLNWNLEKNNNFKIINQKSDYIIIQPLNLIENFIEVSLLEFKLNKKLCHKDWSFKKEMNVISKLKIFKPIENITLPYYENEKQILQLYGIGGTNKNYEWISDNDKIISINSSNGIAKALNKGTVKITLRDKRNILNKDIIEIKVTDINEGFYLEEDMEMLTNKKDHTFYKILNNENNIFLNCTNLLFSFDNNNGFNINLSKINYSNLLKDLDSLKNLYKLDDSVYKNSFEEYEFYFKNKIISKETLMKYLDEYKNFGVCNKIELNSKNQGKYSFMNHFKKENFLNIQVYNDIEKIIPIFDEKIFSNVLHISPDSSVNYKLKGGPTQWINRPNRLWINDVNNNIENKYNFEKLNQNNFIITCKDDNVKLNEIEDEIIITYKNQKDNKLLRPKIMQYKIKLICSLPYRLKIINLENKNVLISDLLRKYLINQDLILRNEKEHLFRVLSLNKENKLFFNYTSLKLDWDITEENKENVKLNHIHDDWHKNINLGSFTGEMKLMVKTENLINTNNKLFLIEDNLTIKSMKNLYIEPKESILFNSEKIIHKLKISNGSGNFNIKIDNPELITLKYDKHENPREILITPKKIGNIKITVEDNELKFSQIVQANIKIVEDLTFKLELNKEYIEKSKIFKTKVKLLYKNKEINNYQLNYIPFSIFDNKNFNLMQNKINFDLYEISSNEVGILNLGVKANLFNKEFIKIKPSKIIEIEVFDSIKILPEKLILSPNCRTSFKYIGGPSDNTIIKNNLKIVYEDSSLGIIKKENKLFYYESLKLGEETVEFKIVNKNNEILTKFSLEIKINFVDNIESYNNFDINIYQYAQLKMLFYPIIDSNQFTKSICNFSIYYKFIKDNSIEIFNENTQQNNEIKKNFCDNNDKYFCGSNNKQLHFYLNAHKINSIKIEILFVFNYGENYKGTKLNKILNLNILERLKIDYPLFINHSLLNSHELLLPPNSSFLLKINKIKSLLKLKKNDNTNKLLEIKDNFLVNTKDVYGFSNLEIENIEIPNEEILIPIRIVKISYIMLKNTNHKEIRIPQNFKIKLDITLLDNFGRIISTPLINFKINSFTLNPNVANCNFNSEDFVLEIQGKNEGKTIIIIELDDNSKIFDIVEINVGPVLENKLPINLHVGSIIQFNLINQKQIKKESKLWYSHNNEIIEINQFNGIAKAKSAGNTIIEYKDIINYKINVNCFKINEIKLINEDLENIITNIKESPNFKKVYKYQIKFFNDKKEIKDLLVKKNLINNNLKINCQCNNNLLNCYYKDTILNDDLSESFCYIEFKKYNKNFKIDFNNEVELKITLQTLDNYYKNEEIFKFDILWAFHSIYENENINFDQNENKLKMEIITPEELSISSNNLKNYITKQYLREKNILILSIDLDNKTKESFKDIISIQNLSTNQIKTYSFNYKYDLSLIRNIKFNFIINSLYFEDYVNIILIIAVAVLAYLFVIRRKEQNKNNDSYLNNEYSYNEKYNNRTSILDNNSFKNSFD